MKGDRVLWLDGAYVPLVAARLPALDHAVLYGAGLFETFRTWGGRAPLLARNLARLRAGCRAYRIEPPPEALLPRAELELPAILAELLSRHGCADAVFRYTVTAGVENPGLPASPYRHPSEMIVLRALPVAPARGRELHILRTRRAAPEFSPRPKSLQQANALAARWEMLDRALPAGAEGLMLTPDGWIAEGVTSNLFFATGRELCTPMLDLGVLPGVTRATVLDLASRNGIRVREDAFQPAALARAGMVFITNAALGLAPIRRVIDESGRTLVVVATARHPVFRHLRARFREVCRAAGRLQT